MAASLGTERFSSAFPLYQRKIRTYSRAHFRSIPGMDQDDLESELQEVLWLACEKYDPQRGATFNTCYWEFVMRRTTDLKRAAFRIKRQANLNSETLEYESVRLVVDEITATGSAEDEALARISVIERLRNS